MSNRRFKSVLIDFLSTQNLVTVLYFQKHILNNLNSANTFIYLTELNKYSLTKAFEKMKDLDAPSRLNLINECNLLFRFVKFKYLLPINFYLSLSVCIFRFSLDYLYLGRSAPKKCAFFFFLIST